MLARIFLWIADIWPAGRRLLFRTFFQAMARIFGAADYWTFMNYGYARPEGDAAVLRLEPRDEPERYCIQLYDHVAGGADLSGMDVLEVSSGRGGGASYICRYLAPKSMTGVDISAAAVAFCSRVHQVPGLRFLQGDAENLRFPDDCFDAVVNVEASFCYGDIDRFLSEVRRVLRPGGYFLYADLRLSHELVDWFGSLRASGLELVRSEDITDNVARALKIDNARRTRWLAKGSPWFMKGIMRTFIGTEGTRIPTLLNSDGMKYFCHTLQNPS
ncbi:MAG: class I SAM-dependent methyltransferase [Planctomycetota bacterium]|jgi:SAM-dependent methyltransferase